MNNNTILGSINPTKAATEKAEVSNVMETLCGHVEGSKAFARYRDLDDNDLAETIKNLGSEPKPQADKTSSKSNVLDILESINPAEATIENAEVLNAIETLSEIASRNEEEAQRLAAVINLLCRVRKTYGKLLDAIEAED